MSAKFKQPSISKAKRAAYRGLGSGFKKLAEGIADEAYRKGVYECIDSLIYVTLRCDLDADMMEKIMLYTMRRVGIYDMTEEIEKYERNRKSESNSSQSVKAVHRNARKKKVKKSGSCKTKS